MSKPALGVGTAYFPDTDVLPNGVGSGAAEPIAARLRGMPRRRRPAMAALAVALVGAGVITSMALYQRADHHVSVVMVTAHVAPGAVITARDVSTTSVTVAVGIHTIPAAQLRQVIGGTAGAALMPGTLLAPSDLAASQPPGPGQQLVPVAVKPSAMPASGLFPGDHVLLVATPGDQGQPGSAAGTAGLPAPVPAVVAAVNATPDADGLDVVDLLVKAAAGPTVAEQASTGQFALIVTKRGA